MPRQKLGIRDEAVDEEKEWIIHSAYCSKNLGIIERSP